MESYLIPEHYDLVTPDGRITHLSGIDGKRRLATVKIEEVSPAFIGYEIDPSLITFNLKSTLAQLGVNGVGGKLHFERKRNMAEVQVELIGIGHLGACMLDLLTVGAYIGKLFAADDRRKVRDPDYLMRMFGRCDQKGRPLLLLGGLEKNSGLILEKIEGRTVAFLSLLDGILTYDTHIYGFLPTLAKALCENSSHTRELLHLHQHWEKEVSPILRSNEMLLVKTAPLHIRTVYGRVIDSFLPHGVHHTSADCLQPDTMASGDVYEFYGVNHAILKNIPLEFYTLEPHREHVFFADRDQLVASLEDPKSLFDAFATAPEPKNFLAAVFIVKGTQMKALTTTDWIIREAMQPDSSNPSHVEKTIEWQPSFPFLKAMEDGLITSQGILLTRHFPTPLLKRMLLNDQVQLFLKRIYFQYPSYSHNGFFSHEDRAMLVDLFKFGISVFWVDATTGKILQYILKSEKEAGLFVPLALVEPFRKSTVFGVYGSNLQEGNFETELRSLLEGVLAMRAQINHPLLNKDTPLALLTGGGSGAMEMGNRVAKSVGILSCANIVDFHASDKTAINEQQQNAYIDAKMTYRLDRLVERQAEFFLDFPIFLPGGIGADFEYALEEVRRKTGSCQAHPVLLFGAPDYWRRKVTSRFQLNRETGMIKGSEWVSNCFFCIQTAKQGLWVLRNFFENKLKIGQDSPPSNEGFVTVRRFS